MKFGKFTCEYQSSDNVVPDSQLSLLKARLGAGLTLLALIFPTLLHAQQERFFRISGPVVTTITSISNGIIVWTNAPTNGVFTVQTVQSLSQTNWVNYIQAPGSNGTTTLRLFDLNPPSGMVFIPAGIFSMGDSFDGNVNSIPLHTVHVSEFYMDHYEVTKGLWDEVYNWATNHGYAFDNSGLGKGTTHPAHTLNWYDAVKWCNARSEKEGRTPAYYTNAGLSAPYRTGQQTPNVNWNTGYRLPTEAEWEKAARGGGRGYRFPWPDVDSITHSQANYFVYQESGTNFYPYDASPTAGNHPNFQTNNTPYTNPVGYFEANGYGLYDMAGNVWEWCWDWYGSYNAAPQTDPFGPTSGSYRVSRGGGWHNDAFYCRTADRSGSAPPLIRNDVIGFRSVLPLKH